MAPAPGLGQAEARRLMCVSRLVQRPEDLNTLPRVPGCVSRELTLSGASSNAVGCLCCKWWLSPFTPEHWLLVVVCRLLEHC